MAKRIDSIQGLAKALYMYFAGNRSFRFSSDVGAEEEFTVTTKKSTLSFTAYDTVDGINGDEVFYYEELRIESGGLIVILEDRDIQSITLSSTGMSIFTKALEYAITLEFRTTIL